MIDLTSKVPTNYYDFREWMKHVLGSVSLMNQ